MPFLVPILPGRFARVVHALGDHFHSLLQRDLYPFGSERPPVQHVMHSMRSCDELEGRSAFGAEATARDGRVRIALDIKNLPILHVDILPAPDSTIRADRFHHSIGQPGARCERRASPGDGWSAQSYPI